METADRIIDVLETFLDFKKGIGVVDLAKYSGNNVTTAYRIASTLVKRGYLLQPKKRGKYYLGPKLLRFKSVINMSNEVTEVARPFLIELNRRTKESVNLALLDENEAFYISHIDTDYGLRSFTQVGNRVPLYCTGVGKVFLADMTDEELNDYLQKQKLLPYTSNTITKREKIVKDIKLVRQNGVATDDEEFERGVKCVSAPIYSMAGHTIASVSISGPSVRIDNTTEKLLKSVVRECAQKISQALVYVTE